MRGSCWEKQILKGMKGEQGSSRLGDTSKSQDALDLEIGTALIFEGVFGFLPFSPQIQSIICVGLYSLNNIKKTHKDNLNYSSSLFLFYSPALDELKGRVTEMKIQGSIFQVLFLPLLLSRSWESTCFYFHSKIPDLYHLLNKKTPFFFFFNSNPDIFVKQSISFLCTSAGKDLT